MTDIQPPSRGKKRQLSVIDDDLEVRSEKRRKTHETRGFVGALKTAFTSVYNFFFGQKMDRVPVRRPSSSEDEIIIVHDSRDKNDDDGEVNVIKEIIRSPEMANFRFVPTGTSTVLRPAVPTTKKFFISTKEKRDRDRKEASKSGFLMQQLREKKITARQNFAMSPGAWRSSPFSPSSNKPTIKRLRSASSANTPRGRLAIQECFRIEELRQYQNVLEKIINVEPDTIDTMSLNRTSTFIEGRTPMFQRSTRFSAPSYSLSRNETGYARTRLNILDKFKNATTKSGPEVITLDDDKEFSVKPSISERPRPSTSDSDVIEIIDAVSPPKSSKVKALLKKKTPPKMDTLSADLKTKEVYQPDFLKDLREKYDTRKKDTEVLIVEERIRADYGREQTDRLARSVEQRLRRHLTITEVAVPDVEPEAEEEGEVELPEISPDMEAEIQSILSSNVSKTLVDAHNIAITRKDLDTLRGLNWLNDEIINFYMQMIVERSSKNADLPPVYAMNTFFLPKLRSSGYSMVRRWTKKVDIFKHDMIFVPVHLDVHWCLAVIDLAKKSVRFYDSMGSDKNDILRILTTYLEQEHSDKKKSPFDVSGFTLENVKDIPRQMNGSDCGMFTLKYAEYLSRNASITFTQEDMPYFRRRMVYEIVNNRVIYP